jgi:demethylsterigmatocystin 6-O-methyltransferase
MRNIMHDYSDDRAVIILKNIVAAMGPDSMILIDDLVLPDVGVGLFEVSVDITMMAGLAARERTLEQWTALLVDKAGLRINRIYRYTDLGDSVIEAVKA